MSVLTRFSAIITFLLLSIRVAAIDIYTLSDEVDEFYFEENYIEVFRDSTNKLTIGQISSPLFDKNFQVKNGAMGVREAPQTEDGDSYYWVRIKIDHNVDLRKVFLLEFSNQSLDEVHYYIPNGMGGFDTGMFGDNYNFYEREIEHKNFEVVIPKNLEGEHYYYFKVKCKLTLEIVIALRTINKFIAYSLNEYLLFGFFYGMIMIVCLYNLLMFLALKEKQFIFYILYIVFFGVYFMADNGTAFQYLWPNSPGLNEKSNAFFLYCVVLWAMLFAREFLNTKEQFPLLDKILQGVIAFRTVLFVVSVFVPSLFQFKVIDVLPILIALGAGVMALRSGLRAARFFVLSYCFLLVGFVVKALVQIGVLPVSEIMLFYSMNIALCFDMLFITFAFGDKISMIRIDKERAHKKIIQSLEKNQKLKDKVNRELEAQVTLRTLEVNENNRLLREANEKLKLQSEEINRMNMMLDLDNRNLKKDIKETLVARIMKPNVDFNEFKRVFPDNISCYKYLNEKKEERGFECHKCGNLKYSEGTKKFSRRCSKCGYNESVTANTIFHGVRFPIEKAFYIFYLTVTRRDDFTIDELSEIVSLRRNTCWAFKKKVVEALDSHNMTDVRDLAESWKVIFT